jgi:hypothetical protein
MTTPEDDFTCNLMEIRDDFVAPAFQETAAIRWTHRGVPRFGYTSDLSALIEGSDEDGLDYVRGMMASSIAIFIFFTLWILVLIVLRCMGPKRVGMWSGTVKPLPPEPVRGRRPKQDKESNGDSPDDQPHDLHLSSSMEQNINNSPKSATLEPGQEAIKEAYKSDGSSSHSSFQETEEEFAARHDAWQELERTYNRRLAFVRGIAIFSCLVIIVNAFLMGFKG